MVWFLFYIDGLVSVRGGGLVQRHPWEIEEVIERGLSEDRSIPVNSVAMYEEIVEFRGMVGAGWTARINTKYKNGTER